MTEQEKQEIEEELKMVYKIDQFIDGNIHVQKRVERSHTRGLEEGKAQGLAQGEIRGLQKAAMAPIKRHFPTLLVQAQPLIEQIQQSEELEELIVQLIAATTEGDVRRVLHIQENQ